MRLLLPLRNFQPLAKAERFGNVEEGQESGTLHIWAMNGMEDMASHKSRPQAQFPEGEQIFPENLAKEARRQMKNLLIFKGQTSHCTKKHLCRSKNKNKQTSNGREVPILLIISRKFKYIIACIKLQYETLHKMNVRFQVRDIQKIGASTRAAILAYDVRSAYFLR